MPSWMNGRSLAWRLLLSLPLISAGVHTRADDFLFITRFSGEALGPSSIRWSWSDIDGELGYRVEALDGTNLSGDLPANTAVWEETGLSPDTSYTRRVVAFNGSSTTASLPGTAATKPDPDPPLSPPADFSGRAESPTRIEWTWSDISGERGYRVESETGANLSGDLPAGTHSWSETGLTPEQTYTRRVTAFNNSSQATSPTASATTPADPDPPLDPPGNFTGRPLSPTSLLWTWTDVDKEKGYRVESVDGANLSGKLSPNTTSWEETGLTPNTSYTRRVVAFNKDFQSPSSPAAATTPPAPDPQVEPPANFNGLPQNPTTIVWSWSDVSGERGFRVMSESGDNLSGDLAANVTSWGETNLSPGTPYSRRVVAFNNNSQAGSALATVSTPPLPDPPLSPPADFSGALQDLASVLWTWTDVSGERGYRVESQNETSLSGNLSADTTSWLETGLSTGTTYRRRVTAFNNTSQAPSSFAEVSVPSQATQAVSTPTAFSGIAQDTATIVWSWSTTAQAAGYRVLSTDGQNLSGDLPAGTTFWREAGLSINTPYTRRVSAFNATSQADSSPDTRHTLANPPGAIHLITLNPISLAAGWDANGNPPGTAYQADLEAAGRLVSQQEVSVTSAAFSGLTDGTTYSLRIQSVNGDGISNTQAATVNLFTPALPPSASFIDPGQAWVLTRDLASGPLSIQIASGTFSEPLILTVQTPPPFVDPPPGSRLTKTGVGFEILLDRPLQPLKPVVLDVTYRNEEVADLNKAQFVLARYDASSRQWVPLNSTSYPSMNRVVGETSHLSVFQVMQLAPANTVSGAVAYPNPFRPSLGHRSVRFDRLPADAQIRIYSLLGELIREIRADVNGQVDWDAKNTSGEEVVSGVYFVRLEGDGEDDLIKLVIQR
ncbi:MAG: fibronectin type III domain-containing protein [Elusimicrobia bacterium]|nr:fibronectin type III domain-containing protein [Elusimicrobiota bacterium]